MLRIDLSQAVGDDRAVGDFEEMVTSVHGRELGFVRGAWRG
jgi:hypothetical protein